jgi:hypothetical protein
MVKKLKPARICDSFAISKKSPANITQMIFAQSKKTLKIIAADNKSKRCNMLVPDSD